MSQNVEMSTSGSITVGALVIAVAFLLRSFYKRYVRMQKREEDDSK